MVTNSEQNTVHKRCSGQPHPLLYLSTLHPPLATQTPYRTRRTTFLTHFLPPNNLPTKPRLPTTLLLSTHLLPQRSHPTYPAPYNSPSHPMALSLLPHPLTTPLSPPSPPNPSFLLYTYLPLSDEEDSSSSETMTELSENTVATDNDAFLQNLDKPKAEPPLLMNGSVPWANRHDEGVTHNTFYIPPAGTKPPPPPTQLS